jgi:YfiH family protein
MRLVAADQGVAHWGSYSLQRQDTNGLVTYRFEALAVENVVHAVFTRLGGVSRGPFATLNVGNGVGDDEAAVAENHARIYAHMDLAANGVASPYQVHGNRVVVVTARDAGQVIPGTDGLVTNAPGVGLLLRFADCQPILLYDRTHHALGLIHAGWRGVALGIARRAVETMQDAFDSQPEELIAGLGPAIGPCCYTVGQNVAAAMGYALPDWRQVMSLLDEDRWRFDLPAANAQQLAAAGVREIERAHLCTACHRQEFFSHRADNGQTGRFAVLAYLKRGNSRSGTGGSQASLKQDEPPAPAELVSLQPPGFPSFNELAGGSP